MSARLREGALRALAALCSANEESRQLVVAAEVVPAMVAALGHSTVAVRSAACGVAKSLSRSVKNLRTALVEVGVAQPLLRLLEDDSSELQTAATGVLCNIVLDFSPIKTVVLAGGGVAKLVALTREGETTLRLHVVWALKNLLYKADLDVKREVMQGS